jgi:hypothetical protein
MDGLCVASLLLISAGLAMLVLGLARVAGFSYAAWCRRSRQHWLTTPGIIVRAEAVQPTLKKPFHSLTIGYDYTVSGQRYTGTRVSDAELVIVPSQVETVLKDHYPVGKPIIVYYDVLDPSQALLYPALPLPIRRGITGIVLLVMGGGMLYGTFWFWSVVLPGMID